MISKLATVYPNVVFGKDCVVEDFAIVGVPPSGKESGELTTVIGDHAVIRSHTVIYAGNRIGSNFQTGNKANLREGNRIGDDVSIGTLSVVEHSISIGDRVRIHSQAFIPEFSVLEDDCWIGPNVVLTNAKYPKSPNVKASLQGPRVAHGAILGANCTVLPGLTIGAKSLVGAGSVVTVSVENNTVVAGNPARFIKRLEDLPYVIEAA